MNYDNYEPLNGKRLTPAWLAAATMLADGEWHDKRHLEKVMLDKSDLTPKTCENLLRNATYAGWLVKSSTGNQTPIRFKVTPAGRALRKELRPDLPDDWHTTTQLPAPEQGKDTT